MLTVFVTYSYFLGLRNLSIIDEALSIIAVSGETPPNMAEIPMDVPGVYEMLSRGETEGVFQLESAGMKQFMKELKPQSIEDVIAGISLYRPGPMDQIPRYVENKNHPEKLSYPHPILEKILDVTYGCMVYQEQVMQIVREMAGYSLGRADLVRRAMSKKKADVMAEERKNFIYGKTDENGNVLIDGAIRRGVSEKVADGIFDEMMDFAQYAFNKSHAAAYSVVTYQTAYLKHFYPAQYMAALLSSVLDSPEKVARYSVECKKMGIRILPPDINKSHSGFTVSGGHIRFGLAVIKNVGTGIIDAIVQERDKKGPFKGYEDFVNRTAYLNVTKRVHEYLIKAGAFDALGESRSALLMAYEGMLSSATENKKRNIEGQISLFGEDLSTQTESSNKVLPNQPEFPSKKLLALEKESVGFYLSGHPLDDYAEKIESLSDLHIMDIVSGDENSLAVDGMTVNLCGIVSYNREKLTKNGQIMSFVTIEDLTGSIECIVFPKIYGALKPYLNEDRIVYLSARLSMREEEEPKLIIQDVTPIEDAEKPAAKAQEPAKTGESDTQKLYLKFCLGKDYLLDRIKEVLDRHKGTVPVYIYLEETKKTALAPESLWVTPCNALLLEVKELLGEENVVLKKL